MNTQIFSYIQNYKQINYSNCQDCDKNINILIPIQSYFNTTYSDGNYINYSKYSPQNIDNEDINNKNIDNLNINNLLENRNILVGDIYFRNLVVDKIASKIIEYPDSFLSIRLEPIVNLEKKIFAYEILTRVNLLNRLKFSISNIIENLQSNNKIQESQTIQKKIIKIGLEKIISIEKNLCRQIWFNISPDCLENSNFILEIIDIFKFYQKNYNISTGIEITEKCNISLNYSKIFENFEILKRNNIKIIMDDFGNDLNNINFISEWEWDAIKINGKLVSKIKSSTSLKEFKRLDIIFKSLLKMIHSLGSHPICEWVETEYQYEILKSYGYTYFQGYLFNSLYNDSLYNNS